MAHPADLRSWRTVENAVIDRIVDGNTALILVGADERQHDYPSDGLPEGAKEGCWLTDSKPKKLPYGTYGMLSVYFVLPGGCSTRDVS